MFKRKDLLGLKDLSLGEMNEIFSTADEMKKLIEQRVKRSSVLQGMSVVTLFYENSTRTRVSFETAAKVLGAMTTSIAASASSVTKGETLIDTGLNLDALLADVIIIRSNISGAPHLLAKNVKASVINAGDGINEHPTQGLLDIYTMRQKLGDLNGAKIVIAGDIKHSRVARSNIWGLNKMGAEVTVAAPHTFIPRDIEKMGCKVCTDLDSAVTDANVIMGLRIQKERQDAGLFPSAKEYHKYFGITEARISKADSNVLIMHPGPINRGVEISSNAADGENNVILEQVTNGVAIRMAILTLLTKSAI